MSSFIDLFSGVYLILDRINVNRPVATLLNVIKRMATLGSECVEPAADTLLWIDVEEPHPEKLSAFSSTTAQSGRGSPSDVCGSEV
jgi:hypothetical protein